MLGIDTLVKKTKPQPIFTEASLLAAMEGCGRTLDDEKEKEAMEDSGLGTPATRAGIIELLIARHYVERNGRSLIPTPKGLEVYDIVKEKMIANVSMTGGGNAPCMKSKPAKFPRKHLLRASIPIPNKSPRNCLP